MIEWEVIKLRYRFTTVGCVPILLDFHVAVQFSPFSTFQHFYTSYFRTSRPWRDVPGFEGEMDHFRKPAEFRTISEHTTLYGTFRGKVHQIWSCSKSFEVEHDANSNHPHKRWARSANFAFLSVGAENAKKWSTERVISRRPDVWFYRERPNKRFCLAVPSRLLARIYVC